MLKEISTPCLAYKAETFQNTHLKYIYIHTVYVHTHSVMIFDVDQHRVSGAHQTVSCFAQAYDDLK